MKNKLTEEQRKRLSNKIADILARNFDVESPTWTKGLTPVEDILEVIEDEFVKQKKKATEKFLDFMAENDLWQFEHDNDRKEWRKKLLEEL